MRVSFIGMSNIGKTYWAKRAAREIGFEHIDCDALIERKLGPELTRLGYRGLRDMAKWMGQPPAPQYEANSARYTACEKEVMQDIIGKLRGAADTDAVVDTTGSVIYTGDETLAALRQATRVIYFEASDDYIETMFRRYIKHPKPTIWGDAYAPRKGETPPNTLHRCYRDLLHDRARRYQALAHATVPFTSHRNRADIVYALIEEARGS